MRIEDYYLFVQQTALNFDAENMYHDWHLTIDDDGTGATQGAASWCGPECSRYTCVIKNTADVDNTVFPALHTWRWRSYAETDKCD